MSLPGQSARVTAVGACHLDRKARSATPFVRGASNPVALQSCPGGVARNVAETLARLGLRAALVSRLGRDAEGEALLAGLAGLPLDLAGLTRSESAPSAFHLIALEPDGEMLVAVADMRVYDEMTPALLQALPGRLWEADALFADCNLPAETLGWLAARRSESRLFAVNGVSPAKARRLRPQLGACDLLFVNRGEAAALVDSAAAAPEALAAALVAAGAGEAVVTLGAAGLAVAKGKETLMLPIAEGRVVDITGAGDALAAAYLEARLRGLDLAAAARRALAAARLTVACAESVSPEISSAALDRMVAA